MVPFASSLIIVVVVVILAMLSQPARSLSQKGAALVTGSTDGIGLTTAKYLAKLGYDVIIHGRNERRIQKAGATVQKWIDKIPRQQDPSSDLTAMIRLPRLYTLPPSDLSTIQGSKQLAHDVQALCARENLQLTILMNNAGVYSEDLIITDDNLEQTFAVNVVAPFIVTSFLLPNLLEAATKSKCSSRIVIASSISQSHSIRDWNDLCYQNRPFSSHASYSESKLMDAMMCFEFARRIPMQFQHTSTLSQGLMITCNCLDPGTVNTKMLLAGWGPCGMDVDAALDETWLCTSEEVAGVTGRYFVGQRDRPASSMAYDENERRKLWTLLSELAPDAAQMWDFEWLPEAFSK